MKEVIGITSIVVMVIFWLNLAFYLWWAENCENRVIKCGKHDYLYSPIHKFRGEFFHVNIYNWLAHYRSVERYIKNLEETSKNQ